MKTKLHWFLLTLVGSVQAFAQAPDSVAGKIFRTRLLLATVRTSSEATVRLGADGRYSALLNGTGGAFFLAAPYKIFLTDPAPDGTYTYQRTGTANATITL